MTETAKASSRLRFILGSVIVLGAFITLLGLGTWQVDRLKWKENLLSTIEQRLNDAPVGIDEIIAAVKAGEDIEYQPVTLTGTFDHTKERHFFATHKGRSGYYVYTPLTHPGGIIFVNRGFVEFDLKEPEMRPDGQIKGEVSITGLSRKMLDQKPSSLVPDNEPDANRFFWKDLVSMANSSGIGFDNPQLQKFFIDADDKANPSGYPIGGVTIIDLPNNHMQYAITWYGLALALFLVAAFFVFRKKRPEKRDD